MKLTRTLRIHPALFQILPLVNVLFLVLMLFAMSSRFVLQPGIAVALPFSPFTMEPQQNPQVVSVTGAPEPAVYHLNRKVTLPELETQLAGAINEKHSLIIKADVTAPYALVVQVMNLGLKNGFAVVLAATPEKP